MSSVCKMNERVAAYAAGEPDDALATHLPSCASCRAELEEARAVLRGLGELAAPARAPGREDALGEPFWSDFGREVRVAYQDAREAKRRRRRRLAWVLGPMMAAAAAGLLLLALRGGEGGDRGPQVALVDAGGGEAAPAEVEEAPLTWTLREADALAAVEALDEAEVEAALAELDDDALDEEAPGEDPLDTLESLDEDEVDRAYRALAPG